MDIHRASLFIKFVPIILLAGCCSNPFTTAKTQGVRIDLVLNQLKTDINEIGTYDIEDEVAPNECGEQGKIKLKAIPDSATVTLKTALNQTITGNVGGNIPTGFVITLMGSGTHTKVKTQQITINLGVANSDQQRPVNRLKSTEGPPIATFSGEERTQGTEFRDAVFSAVQGLINMRHTKPCVKPTKITVEIAFQVSNKIEANGKINFVVANIGGGYSTTRDDVHTLAVTVNLAGTSALMQ